MRTKTGMMLGLGETKEEVVQSMKDLVNVGCDVLTLGQYLQPTKNTYPYNVSYTPTNSPNSAKSATTSVSTM